VAFRDADTESGNHQLAGLTVNDVEAEGYGGAHRNLSRPPFMLRQNFSVHTLSLPLGPQR
jgi:hypothetical protein